MAYVKIVRTCSLFSDVCPLDPLSSHYKIMLLNFFALKVQATYM
jgi:hypothetical protein